MEDAANTTILWEITGNLSRCPLLVCQGFERNYLAHPNLISVGHFVWWGALCLRHSAGNPPIPSLIAGGVNHPVRTLTDLDQRHIFRMDRVQSLAVIS